MNIEQLEKLLSGYSKEDKESMLAIAKISPWTTYEAHSIQKKFHNSQKRYRWFFGGNRSGKTRAGLQEIIWYATGQHPTRKVSTPCHIWAVSQDFPSSRGIVQPTLRHLLGQSHLRNWNETYRVATLKNESTIEFKSCESGWDKFQGTAKHLIWFDEEPDREVYTECLVRIVDYAGDIIGTMTPTHGMSWVYDDIYEPWESGQRRDLIDCFMASSFDNPHGIKAELERLKKEFGSKGELYESRLLGKFVEFAGLIYKEFNRNVHAIKRFSIPSHYSIYRGLDPGVNNPTACIWIAISPDNEHFVFQEYYASDKTVEENATAIKTITGNHEVVTTYIDPSSGNRNPAHPELRSVRDEYSRCNLYTTPANNDVSFGINEVKKLLKVKETSSKPRLFIFDDCYNTIKELARYRWDTHRHHASEKNPKEKPKKISDHLMDALRYVEAAMPIYTGVNRWGMFEEDTSERKSQSKWTKYG